MRRGLILLLCAYLLVWIPVGFAIELFASVSSLAMRGGVAILELAAHAAVAMFCAVAGYMLLIRAPAARGAARAAVIVAALGGIQAIYWTVLPRQLAPGEALPTLAVVCGSAVFWVFVLRIGAELPAEGGGHGSSA
jgi:hypothetical protein